ncbi:MAG TPA: PP0621 family protein [Burkholderiales bacterium]|nr:PP0621 family protein [Burkholderiales bacterium]
MKFLLLLIVIAVVYWLFTSYKRKARREAEPKAPAGAEDMVRCAQCGLHLPRSESLPAGTRFYCSAEHRRQSEPSD